MMRNGTQESTHLKVHIAGPAVSLFGPNASGFQRESVTGAVLGRLYYRSKRGKFLPGILDGFAADANFKAWSLKIRKSLRFQNGRGLVARDLEFTLNNIRNTRVPTPESSLLKDIKKIVVKSDSEIVVHLGQPNPYFLETLDDPSFGAVPKEELNTPGSDLIGASPMSGSHLSWKKYPVGAGPYKITKAESDRVFLEKLGVVPTQAPNTIEIATGPYERADLALGFDENPDEKNLKGVSLCRPWGILGIYFNYDSKLARNERFRQAVSMAVDRKELSKTARGLKVTSSILPSNLNKKANANLRSDQAQAKAFFKEVLAESDRELSIPIDRKHASSGIAPWMKKLEDQFKRCGLKVRFVISDDVIHFKMESGAPSPFRLITFIPGLPRSSMIFQLFRNGSSWVPHLDKLDEVYERLIDKIAETGKEDVRSISRLSELFLKNAYAVPLFEKPLGIWINKERIQTIHEDEQDLSFRFEKVFMKRNQR
ncbi:MAG: ABC transporter substrate-binding protein [Bdellovibrionota bacterium]